jgi:RNA polymerase-binding transcription factor DksA
MHEPTVQPDATNSNSPAGTPTDTVTGTGDERTVDHRQPEGPMGEPVRLGQRELDAIERDLADVETALARLDAGTYRTCEITGDPLDESYLAANPTARRRPIVGSDGSDAASTSASASVHDSA